MFVNKKLFYREAIDLLLGFFMRWHIPSKARHDLEE